MEKVRAELAVFSIEKSTCFTSDIIFIVCTLMDNSYEAISALELKQLLENVMWSVGLSGYGTSFEIAR